MTGQQKQKGTFSSRRQGLGDSRRDQEQRVCPKVCVLDDCIDPVTAFKGPGTSQVGHPFESVTGTATASEAGPVLDLRPLPEVSLGPPNVVAASPQ